MSDLDRRSIRPAHPQATIPDPDHRDDLPAEGRDVVWSSYWALHLTKGNVELFDPAASATPDAPAADPAH